MLLVSFYLLFIYLLFFREIMSQLDLVHYLPTLFWMTCGLVLYFFLINGFFVFSHYRVFRIRYLYENFLFSFINKKTKLKVYRNFFNLNFLLNLKKLNKF